MTEQTTEPQEYVCLLCMHDFLLTDIEPLECPHCGCNLLEPVIQSTSLPDTETVA